MIEILPLDELIARPAPAQRAVLANPQWGSIHDFYAIFEQFGPPLARTATRAYLLYVRRAGETHEEIAAVVCSNLNSRVAAEFSILVGIVDDLNDPALTVLQGRVLGLLALPSAGPAWITPADSPFSCRRILSPIHLLGVLDLDMPPTLARYLRTHYDCPGWYGERDLIACDILLDYQQRERIRGHLLEIGVYHGKSAAHWSEYARADEKLVLIDHEMSPDVEGRVAAAHPTNNQLRYQWSYDLRADDPLLAERGAYRWVHIDGGHTGDDVQRDLDLVSPLLGEAGIIVVDDVFSHDYPQVTWSLVRWLEQHREEFTLLLCSFSKAFLCRPASHQRYLRFLKDQLVAGIKARGVHMFSVYKTTRPSDLNAFSFKFWEQVTPEHLVGPDWDRSAIEI